MTPIASGTFDPEGRSARAIADLWWLLLALGTAVFVLFAVLLVLGLFRKRSPDPESEEPGGGSERRWLLGGGVVMPIAVLIVVFGATIAAMRTLGEPAPQDALVVEVVGHQWWWEVRYTEEGFTTANELHMPVGRPVALRLTSADVIHSFWVPALGGKMDLLPNDLNTLVLQADEPGEHLSQCAEFCGLQHAKMALTVVAEPPEQFASWVDERREPATEPSGEEAQRGREVFLAAGCGSCHTIRGTAASGTKGPDLTHLASRPTLAAGTVANTARQRARWISDPGQIKEGVKMPQPELSSGERDALLAYLDTLR